MYLLIIKNKIKNIIRIEQLFKFYVLNNNLRLALKTKLHKLNYKKTSIKLNNSKLNIHDKLTIKFNSKIIKVIIRIIINSLLI